MTEKIDPQFNEWLLKERLKNSLAARFLLRFHASFLMLVAVGTGWLTNRLMFAYGVESMFARHVVAVLAAYGGFLLGLQFWIEFSGIKDFLNVRRADELLKGPIAVLEKKDKIGFGDIPFEIWPFNFDGCAVVILFILAIIVIFYLMGGYLVVHAADFFAEVVFELILAAGLIKGVRKVDLLGSQGRVPMVTLWALGLTLTTVVIFEFWARHEYPGARTMSEIVNAVRTGHSISRK